MLRTLFSRWSFQKCVSELAKWANLPVEIKHEKLRRVDDLHTAFFKVLPNDGSNEAEHLMSIRCSVNPERSHLIYCACNVI